jgi:hypothetical protein
MSARFAAAGRLFGAGHDVDLGRNRGVLDVWWRVAIPIALLHATIGDRDIDLENDPGDRIPRFALRRKLLSGTEHDPAVDRLAARPIAPPKLQ